MIILGVILLLVGYLLFKHPIIVGIGWLLLVLGLVFLFFGPAIGVHTTTY